MLILPGDNDNFFFALKSRSKVKLSLKNKQLGSLLKQNIDATSKFRRCSSRSPIVQRSLCS